MLGLESCRSTMQWIAAQADKGHFPSVLAVGYCPISKRLWLLKNSCLSLDIVWIIQPRWSVKLVDLLCLLLKNKHSSLVCWLGSGIVKEPLYRLILGRKPGGPGFESQLNGEQRFRFWRTVEKCRDLENLHLEFFCFFCFTSSTGDRTFDASRID